jgi:hypothetical protein
MGELRKAIRERDRHADADGNLKRRDEAGATGV